MSEFMSDAEAAKVWRIIEPGVLGLPTTAITVMFRENSMISYEVLWKGKAVPGGLKMSLSEAKKRAEEFTSELIEMGLEP